MDKELVFKTEKGIPVTNSLLVAEKFGKRHDNVLRDIETLIVALLKIEDTPMFLKTTYIHEQNNQAHPMYLMNRDGFSLLVMGFTGSKALAFKLEFIEAFNRAEEMLKNDDYIIARSQEILHNRLQAAQQKLQILEGETLIQKEEIKKLAPKAEFTDKVLQSTGTFTTTQIAQGLNLSAGALNIRLSELGVQYKQSGQWHLYAKYKNKNIATIRIASYRDMHTGEFKSSQSMVWTEKGRKFIHDLLTTQA